MRIYILSPFRWRYSIGYFIKKTPISITDKRDSITEKKAGMPILIKK